MTSYEAYKKLLLKVNKNDTNADIDISKGEFVLLFNEQKSRWLKQKIGEKDNRIDAQDLQDIQVKFKTLDNAEDKEHYSTFTLPSNFFSYISSYSVCSDGKCKGLVIRNYPIKPSNENMLLEDANNAPSLEFEETVVDLSDNKLFVYKKDFTVDSVVLNYYKNPTDIDLAGYIKLDGDISTDINPDIDDVNVDEIVDRCAVEIIRRYENPDGFALAKDRLAQEK